MGGQNYKFKITTMNYIYNLERDLLGKSITAHAHHLTGKCLDVGSRGKESRYYSLLHNIDGYVSLDPDAGCLPDVVGGAENLPFENESFDSILCTQVLDDVPDPRLALQEFNRVLKKGGHLLISVPVTTALDGPDLWRFTPTGLKLLLHRAGFAVIVENTLGGAFSIRNQILNNVLKTKYSLGEKNRVVRGVFNKLFKLYSTLCNDKASSTYVMNVVMVAVRL